MNKHFFQALVILTTIIAIAVAVTFTANTTFQTWHAEGTFHFAGNIGENKDLGYVRDGRDYASTFTTWINPPADNKDLTLFANGIPAENQQTDVFRLFVRRNNNSDTGRYFSVVRITGPVAISTFMFFPFSGETVVIYNFDKVVVKADLKSVDVYTKGQSTPQNFTNGNWGYRTEINSPILANDGVAGYITKGGFGSICSEINADCPHTSVELYANDEDHWVYYPGYQHEITITP